MSKFHVGDKVRIKDSVQSNGVMNTHMLGWFGGRETTIREVDDDYDMKHECNYYTLDIDPDFYFSDHDLELVEENHFTKPISQRIEIPVPGGHLAAVTTDYGGGYPGIHVFFVASGDTVEHDLCFAEICAEDDPDTIRVGTYFEDGSDVRDIMEYTKWKKEEE